MLNLHGTFTALVTPFDQSHVDAAALELLVERQLAAGVEGLVPCGTTGESPTLTPAEHRAIVTLVARLAKGKALVVAGSGSNSTAHTLELARLNADCGADALLVVAPYYNKPSQDGLYRHFATLAEATRLPIVLYNIPGRCGVEIAVETIRKLHGTYPHIVAVKHATGDLLGAADLLSASNITLLSGDDVLNVPLMSIGATGTVSAVSNAYPTATKRLIDALRAHDAEATRSEHRRFYPLARALMTLDTNPVPVKTALALGGLCREEFRLPLCPLSPEKRARLESLLAKYPLE